MKKSREKLMDKALELFASKGFEATSVHEICKSAGVSKGAFYHYFETKQKLFSVLLEDWLCLLQDNMRSVMNEADTTPETIRKMAMVTGPTIKETRAAFPILVEYWRQQNLGNGIAEDLNNSYLQYRHVFKDLIEKGIKEGSIAADLDPDLYSRLLQSTAMGYLLTAWVSPEQEDWDKILNDGIEVILRTMVAKK